MAHGDIHRAIGIRCPALLHDSQKCYRRTAVVLHELGSKHQHYLIHKRKPMKPYINIFLNCTLVVVDILELLHYVCEKSVSQEGHPTEYQKTHNGWRP